MLLFQSWVERFSSACRTTSTHCTCDSMGSGYKTAASVFLTGSWHFKFKKNKETYTFLKHAEYRQVLSQPIRLQVGPQERKVNWLFWGHSRLYNVTFDIICGCIRSSHTCSSSSLDFFYLQWSEITSSLPRFSLCRNATLLEAFFTHLFELVLISLANVSLQIHLPSLNLSSLAL